ncbi:MAG: hypothetical protein ABI968_09415 [Acidobacteriota bacterium]
MKRIDRLASRVRASLGRRGRMAQIPPLLGRCVRMGLWVGLVIGPLSSGCASQPGPSASAPAAATPTRAPTVPRPPASLVPDQPYTGTPRPADRPYLRILRLREEGQSNETLLEKVRGESVLFSLSTSEIQKLRAAGVSENVIEAMLASGRQSRTPTPTPRGS